MFYRGPQVYQFFHNCHVFTLFSKGVTLPYLSPLHAQKSSRSRLYSKLDPELFCACRGERSRALGSPGLRLSLIGFSKKQQKCFWLVHSSLHESGWTCGVSGVWTGFSLEMLKWNTTGRFLILGNLRTTTKFTTATSVDWEKTGTRPSVLGGKRKLKMQSVGRSTTTTC